MIELLIGEQAARTAFGPSAHGGIYRIYPGGMWTCERSDGMIIVDDRTGQPQCHITADELDTRIWLFRSGNLPALRIPLR